jgi:hypothetical protein
VTAALHSFGWLLRHHPDAHASILAANGGDRAAAAENWEELQEQIQQGAAAAGVKAGVKAERVRCHAHVELASLAGDTLLALHGIESGASAESMHGYYLEQAGASGQPLAVALVRAALNRKNVSS